MKKLFFILTGLSIVLNMYLLLVSIPQLKSKIKSISLRSNRYIDAYDEKDEIAGHPFPIYAEEYCVYEPNTVCPRLIIHSTKWTDNTWKDVDVTFIDRDNVQWMFMVLAPFDPTQYIVKRKIEPNTDNWDKVPIHFNDRKAVR